MAPLELQNGKREDCVPRRPQRCHSPSRRNAEEKAEITDDSTSSSIDDNRATISGTILFVSPRAVSKQKISFSSPGTPQRNNLSSSNFMQRAHFSPSKTLDMFPLAYPKSPSKNPRSPRRTGSDLFPTLHPGSPRKHEKSPRRAGSTHGRVQSPSDPSKRLFNAKVRAKEIKRAYSTDMERRAEESAGDRWSSDKHSAPPTPSPRRSKRGQDAGASDRLRKQMAESLLGPPDLPLESSSSHFSSVSADGPSSQRVSATNSSNRKKTGGSNLGLSVSCHSPSKRSESRRSAKPRRASLTFGGKPPMMNLSVLLESDARTPSQQTTAKADLNKDNGPRKSSRISRRRASCHGNLTSPPPDPISERQQQQPQESSAGASVDKPLMDLYEYLDTSLESNWASENENESVNVALRCMKALSRLQAGDNGARNRGGNAAISATNTRLKKLDKGNPPKAYSSSSSRKTAQVYPGKLEGALKSLEQAPPANDADIAKVKKLHCLARQTLERAQSKRSIVSNSTRSTISSVGHDYSIPWWSSAAL